MRRLLPLFTLSILFACSSSGGDDGAGGGGGSGACAEPTSQSLSQPCCLGHGVDACGANLFCAAFDGRTQATCYPERSRLDNTECADDLHCVSGSCNTTEHKCRAMPYSACTAPVGCAPGPSGDVYACVDDGQGPRCQQLGNGGYDEVCIDDEDCVGYVCRDGRCSFDLACQLPGDGTGPCIRDPDGGSCQMCIQAAISDCFSDCPAEGATFGGCANTSGCADASCILETCGDSFCDFFLCAAENCDTQVDCF